MAGVFVNYRSSDEVYGAILIDRMLAAHFGDDMVFRDSRSIPAGSDFPPFLWRTLRESQVMVCVIGPHWLEADEYGRRRIDDPDDYVRQEIADALGRDIPVIPVLLDDTSLPAASSLPEEIASLSRRQYRHVRRRNVEHDMERILTEIERWVPRRDPSALGAGAAQPGGTVIAPQIGSIHGPVAMGPNASAVEYNGDSFPRTEPQ